MYKPKKEDFIKIKNAALDAVRKVGKRNLTIVLAVLLIGVAVYLNFALFYKDYSKNDVSDPSAVSESKSNATYVSSDGEKTSAADAYFASALISRSRARDEAMEVLQLVVENSETSPDAKKEALSEISQIAADIENESNIETLVKSKGFNDCVAVISGTSCSVIVSSTGLMPSEIAQIQEIVYEQSGILPINLTIIEKS
ncbi:MAG: SpoIIIAH-like family protein [Firmicutes bacterium]|nr:SpoIIIAH-like family protein [Bacillota bacterium]